MTPNNPPTIDEIRDVLEIALEHVSDAWNEAKGEIETANCKRDFEKVSSLLSRLGDGYQIVRATAAPQPATHEPSLASRLGPSGECQAQGETHVTE